MTEFISNRKHNQSIEMYKLWMYQIESNSLLHPHIDSFVFSNNKALKLPSYHFETAQNIFPP